MTKAVAVFWLVGTAMVGLVLALLADGPRHVQASCLFDPTPNTYEGPQDRSLYLDALELAAFDKLLPGDPYFGLPAIEEGTRNNRTFSSGANVPPTLLKGLAWIETSMTHADVSVPFEAIGPVLVNFACAHGITQIVSGMLSPDGENGMPSPEQVMVATHFAYNIARGTVILVDKWNKAPQTRPIAGTDTNGDPAIMENWYFAVWSYNGFTGPGANRSNHPMDPIYGSWPRVPYSCGPSSDGFGHNRSNYPFQELVFGCASRPPQVNGDELWEPQPIDLPDLNDSRWSRPLALSNFVFPYDRMDIPTPRSSGSRARRATEATETPESTAESESESTDEATPTAEPSPTAESATSGAVGHRDPTRPPSSRLRADLFGSPSLSVSTRSVDLAFSQQTGTDSVEVEISNSGTGILSWMAIPSASWLKVTPIAGIAAGGDLECASRAPCERTATLTITLDTTRVLPGTRTATVIIMAPGANEQKRITVTAEAVVRIGAPGVTRN